jgi:hypothetical protein
MPKLSIAVFRKTVCVCLFALCTCANATPSWFDPGNYFFSFTGTMGPGDIDRVVPTAHPILGGQEPGREWFAWATVGFPGVVLSSWEGYDAVGDVFLGFLGFDLTSSPVTPSGPAIGGVVRPDGGIYICISQTGDEDCNRTGGFGGSNEYNFFLALAPVDEPPTLALAVAAFMAMIALIRKRVRRGVGT